MLNRAACALLGVDGAEVLSQTFNQLVSNVQFRPGIASWLAKPGFQGQRHASRKLENKTLDLLF